MSENFFIKENTIVLSGGCGVEQAAELARLLDDALAQVAEREEGGRCLDLDLTGICELDACGCQLLAVVMENARRRGVTPSICGIDEGIRRSAELLGFADLLADNSARLAAW